MSQQRQLDSGQPDPLEPPHLDPWLTTVARPADPAAEATARAWLAAGDLDGPRRGGSTRGPRRPRAARRRRPDVEVHDLFSAGTRVAFHASLQRCLRRRSRRLPAPTGARPRSTWPAVLTVDDGTVTAVHAVTDRFGTWLRKAAGSRRGRVTDTPRRLARPAGPGALPARPPGRLGPPARRAGAGPRPQRLRRRRPLRRRAGGRTQRRRPVLRPGLPGALGAGGADDDQPGRPGARRPAAPAVADLDAPGRGRPRRRVPGSRPRARRRRAGRAPSSGAVEVVDALAAPLPCRITARMIGFAEADWPKVKSWSERQMRLDTRDVDQRWRGVHGQHRGVDARDAADHPAAHRRRPRTTSSAAGCTPPTASRRSASTTW